jgi:regulator of protease activity HflC (stomatin/prohibitin superfamily)
MDINKDTNLMRVNLPEVHFSRAPLFLVLLVIALGGGCAVSCVPTGNVGIVTRFGKVTGTTLTEGLNFVTPLYQVHDMSVRTQELKEVSDTPSEEGLIFKLEVSLLFRLAPGTAAQVYQTVGTEYTETIIVPTFRSAIRAVTSAHKAADLYSTARERVQEEMFEQVHSALLPRGVVVEKVLLRDMSLPPTLKSSIESKQQAEQESQKMQFTLTRETQEADRKRIEARGIADFQTIVTSGISDKLLEWKGIEATLELAKSPNAKVVVIGSSKSGLPLILGQ